MERKSALILGLNSDVGKHLVPQLKSKNYWIRGVSSIRIETDVDHFVAADLTRLDMVENVISYAKCNRDPYQTFNLKFDIPFDEIHVTNQEFGQNDNRSFAEITHDIVVFNLHLLDSVRRFNSSKNVSQTKIIKYTSMDEISAPHEVFLHNLYKTYSQNHNIEMHVSFIIE